MKNNRVRGIILVIVLLAVFCLVAFLPPFSKTTVFWIAFIFGLVATAAQFYFFRYVAGSDATPRSRFYGIPIARVGIIYCIVQWILSILEMIFAARWTVWIIVLIDVVVLAVALLGGILADTVRNEVERQDETLQENISAMRKMQSLAASIAGQCEEPSLKEEMNKLSEEIRYSDPVASENTSALESEMLGQLWDIQTAVKYGNGEEAKDLAKKVMDNLSERNRICKLYK